VHIRVLAYGIQQQAPLHLEKEIKNTTSIIDWGYNNSRIVCLLLYIDASPSKKIES
jgi:hypothetical protein